ncbi:acyl-CoA synthetase [Pseudomonas sp. MPR-R2A7]|nr:acyl-CoA synthetase [Pseudomonas sp. GW460-12]PMX34512.1 acyl-CoA synthetase [Pseudomonas sp. MPR-R2A4]PMX41921.1 acyl-CoA synthetase [Pseudomonas sp. MPR-R2A7]PMX53875.1 acyl-CoA synthetase [Pseudomonas sp. MPR-R2A6]PMX91357.1 acyl-CoA synthetase [Pseudomonas sp. MPR-R2A3]PMY14357.1 acyl-CoA synthetase [Pseudomonas sp. MPR-R2A5]PNA34949.1 acyl-CoA synthetase [Pseudomonas sp. MPR-ANB1]PNA48121.1 acyl-CoA synthetase [Pseudomonas sp. MPR-LB5]PNA76667.1 acyl-CoA synthetase [Pseudomonas sp. 
MLYPGVHAGRSPEKPAVIMAETGATLTYKALDTYANQLGRLYQWLGLKPGDHVAYCLENRLECPAVQWGAHYAGLYYTFISTRLTDAEAAYIVADCEAQVLVVSAKTADRIIDAVRALPKPPKIYSLDPVAGLKLLDDAVSAFDDTPIRGAVEGSEMLYSSGTTGRPKGVKPTLSGLPLGSTAVIAGLMQRGFGVGEDSVYFSPSPYYHAAPMKWGQGMTILGGTLIMASKFDAEYALKAIELYGVTHSQWVPTMFHRLLALPQEVRECYDLSSQKVAVHAGAPCPVPTKHEMIRWWGPILAEFYSCTETIGSTMVDSKTWLERPGTVGRAILGELHIVSEDGRELPASEDGLVYFANGPRFSYHKDEDKTREAYNEQGWVTVGDIGHIDADGFLYLTDRKNNMIISGGVNVYPQETENVLVTHPKVFDVAVIGTPHSDLGEEVRAVVQLEPGVEPNPSLADELIAFCRNQLSPIKCPRVIDFADSLPREPNGKLLKRLLRDEYRARMS